MSSLHFSIYAVISTSIFYGFFSTSLRAHSSLFIYIQLQSSQFRTHSSPHLFLRTHSPLLSDSAAQTPTVISCSYDCIYLYLPAPTPGIMTTCSQYVQITLTKLQTQTHFHNAQWHRQTLYHYVRLNYTRLQCSMMRDHCISTAQIYHFNKTT